MKLDEIDRNILKELQTSGRESASHIAEKNNVCLNCVVASKCVSTITR